VTLEISDHRFFMIFTTNSFGIFVNKEETSNEVKVSLLLIVAFLIMLTKDQLWSINYSICDFSFIIDWTKISCKKRAIL